MGRRTSSSGATLRGSKLSLNENVANYGSTSSTSGYPVNRHDICRLDPNPGVRDISSCSNFLPHPSTGLCRVLGNEVSELYHWRLHPVEGHFFYTQILVRLDPSLRVVTVTDRHPETIWVSSRTSETKVYIIYLSHYWWSNWRHS